MYYNETSLLRYYEANSTELMSTMTSQLRGEASLVAAADLFSKVSYLTSSADVEPDFLSKAALALISVNYCPREQIPTDALSIVVRGLVAYRGRIGVTAVAEDVILSLSSL